MGNQLQVYYDSRCSTAHITQELVMAVRNIQPGLSIEVIDLNEEGVRLPTSIFAVPTYLLDGAPVFLGNPPCRTLIERIQAC